MLSASANKERLEAQAGVNTLSEEALDLSFNGLCFGRQPPPYDARCPFVAWRLSDPKIEPSSAVTLS